MIENSKAPRRVVHASKILNMFRFRIIQPSLAILFLLAQGTIADAQTKESFDCVIGPATVANIGSPTIGLLKNVLVDRGDTVKKGQKIAQLESQVEAATVEFNKARAESEAAIEVQEERLALSQKALDRVSQLVKKDTVSVQRMDEAASEARIYERELAAAKLQKRLAELELARSEAMLRQRTIRGPFDGVVIERKLSPGEFVDSDSYILTLAKLDPLHVEAYLPVRLFPLIKIGMKGIVEPADPIGGALAARVSVVDRVFDAASGTFGVRLELPNPNDKLPAGIRCRVTFRAAVEK